MLCNGKKTELPINVCRKKEKLNDVDKLLQKHCGDTWRDMETLEYYKNTIDEVRDEDEEDDDCICEPLEDVLNI